MNKRTLLPIILLALITIPAMSALCIDDAEAASDYLVMETDTLTKGNFDTRNTADVSITITNNTDSAAKVEVWITYQDGSNVLNSTEIEVASDKKDVAVLSLKFENQGIKYLRIHAKSDDASFNTGGVGDEVGHNFTIDVSQSIWSNTITYVAIVAIIIVVAVAVYLRQRGAPKAEPQMTFTELEEMRKSQRKGIESSDSSRRRPSAERRKYEGNRRGKR